MLLYARGSSDKLGEPVTGVTRLNKLLFLLEKEADETYKGFEFIPYKMGPYSSQINPVLEFLTNFPSPQAPLVELKVGSVKSGTNVEQTHYIDELASSEDKSAELDKYNTATFSLTDQGAKLAEEIWRAAPAELKQSIEKVKRKYTSLTLKDLLRYVYSAYPEMTVKSEIKDQL
jgi:hypothetical protein